MSIWLDLHGIPNLVIQQDEETGSQLPDYPLALVTRDRVDRGLAGAVALCAFAPFPVQITLGEEPSMLDRITVSVVQHRLEAMLQETYSC